MDDFNGTSPYLFSKSLFLDEVDSANYALGIKNYNLFLNQPHPPGTTVYVFLAKCLYLFGFSADDAFTIIACLSGCLFIAAWFCILLAHINFSALL